MNSEPVPSESDRDAVERAIRSAHECEIEASGVTVEITAIAPDYRAAKLTLTDKNWWQKSLAKCETCWFTTVLRAGDADKPVRYSG